LKRKIQLSLSSKKNRKSSQFEKRTKKTGKEKSGRNNEIGSRITVIRVERMGRKVNEIF